MKNNSNPYTVPEGFFETIDRSIFERHSKRVKACRRSLIAAVAAVALLVAVPVLMKQEAPAGEDAGVCATADNLAMMYEYDIFLQVIF